LPDQICEQLIERFNPGDVIEQIFVGDLNHLTLEIARLRRAKTAIVNLAMRPALANLLNDMLRVPGSQPYPSANEDASRRTEADRLARGWFSGEGGKTEVRNVLKQFHLNESAIEAAAINRTVAQLEQLDRMLASLETRCNRALRNIAEYRSELAKQLRTTADQIIDGEVIDIDPPKKKKGAAA
jgi:hypothetical protein